MVAAASLNILQDVADAVARALSYARVVGDSAFVTTAVTYPDGAAAVVRLEGINDRFFVSDDGYGALSADLMGAMPSFNRVATAVAARAGIGFDYRSFFILEVSRDQLPGAVATIANASVQAVERTIYAVEQMKDDRSRIVFEARLNEAFGSHIKFDAIVHGATKEWEIDGVLEEDGSLVALFEFVRPAVSAVAMTHMRLGDIRAIAGAPRTIVALADYQKTEPSLRSILSSTSDLVISADDAVAAYLKAA